MADDGITTLQEVMEVLLEAQRNCKRDLEAGLPPKDKDGNYYETYCKGEWDKITCWPNSAPGRTVRLPCPEYIIDFDHTETVDRYCMSDGTWHTSLNEPNRTWNDYSRCPNNLAEPGTLFDMILAGGSAKMKSFIQLYTVGYSFSLVALVFAMIILAYFKRLHCTRNYIHMHLFASFILRAVVIFVKDRVLYYGAGILDINTPDGEMTLEALKNRVDEIDADRSSYLVGCKLVMTLFHYFVATNYYWILVEALYLHSLIFVAFFSDKKYLWRFSVTGWGVPILFVVPWAIVRAKLDDTACWDIAVTEYKWIYNGPIVVANVINFLLFLNIIRVLWYKMRERGPIGKTDNRRQYKKLAKSTLVLIPMFGVHAIVFIGMPDDISSGTWWDIRMSFDLFFNSFQGFFVAIIYCFCNGEVQAEFRKAWERFNLSVEIKRGRRERSRSSVTMLTSFNSSASQQARLSIGGQSNGRGNLRNNALSTHVVSETKSLTNQKPECSNTNDVTSCQVYDETMIQETSLTTRHPNNEHVTVEGNPHFREDGDVTIPEGEFENAIERHFLQQITCPADSFPQDVTGNDVAVTSPPRDEDSGISSDFQKMETCDVTVRHDDVTADDETALFITKADVTKQDTM
uniref:parathyroid hormone 2 receptor-like isoform X2 n=1 Tax=Ciona intestinalis TaxID=7719 RepID=UPI00089DCBFE|nr:parathyroid hormone 2 receptor-like isoform X2 [Ciona intestinalis]|eukprot:XP_018671173.1 parathyroid hormone 2 receptor-like isoform X2 [Ciona intestinalis]